MKLKFHRNHQVKEKKKKNIMFASYHINTWGKVRKGNKKTGGVGWDQVGSAQRCMSPALVSSFGGSITSLIFDNKILQVLQTL